MRDLIEAVLQIGLKVEFSTDTAGCPTIRVYPVAGADHDHPLFSCVLTPGTFKESSEEALAGFLKSIQKKH